MHKLIGAEKKIKILILFSIIESMSHSFPSETCTPLFPILIQNLPLSLYLKNIELSYHSIPISFSLYPTWFPELFMDFHVFALIFCAVSSAQNLTFLNPNICILCSLQGINQMILPPGIFPYNFT